jgi:hypothetical protein
MTVAELIEKLQGMPQDATVYISTRENQRIQTENTIRGIESLKPSLKPLHEDKSNGGVGIFAEWI